MKLFDATHERKRPVPVLHGASKVAKGSETKADFGDLFDEEKAAHERFGKKK